jgi:hypothetical protein
MLADIRRDAGPVVERPVDGAARDTGQFCDLPDRNAQSVSPPFT